MVNNSRADWSSILGVWERRLWRSERERLRKGRKRLARDRTVEVWVEGGGFLEGFLDFCLGFGTVVRIRSVKGWR